MKLSKILSASTAAIAAATAIPSVVYAQQITSEIRGFVTDATGAPLSGATVTVTDTRTGATRTTTTSGNGGYAARNLSVGGPYTVTARASGAQGRSVEGVFISVSGSTTVSFDLDAAVAGGSGDEIVVVASRANTSALAIGPSSSFGLETLEALPSISRDIRDIIRIDPRVVIDGTNDDNISCLGFNNRFNLLTIDGVQANDPFGLNASGFPARNAQPLPFDAIRETAVEFAPFDVEYDNFQGCAVNVVTKSGTNEFHGSAFAVFNSSGLTGSTLEGRDVSGDDFRDYNWGASVGGPIIKDKLFFFVAYEEVDDGGDIVNDGPEDGPFSSPVLGLTTAEVDQVSQILQDTYGLTSGGISSVLPEESRRIFGRVDWQINDNHRLEASYLRFRESNVEPDDLGFDAQFIFGNTFEVEGSEIEQYSARLFSQWTENLSSEIRFSRIDNQDLQDPVGGGEAQTSNPIPRFLVTEDDGNVLLNGPGQFRSANVFDTQIDLVRAKVDYTAGAHTFTLGYDLNQLDVFNLFVVNATGTFEFDSIADLEAGVVSNISQNGSFSGDINDAAATFSRSIHSVYAQDEWRPTDALTLTLGLRYNFYVSSDEPTLSQAFLDRYGFDNTQGFDGFDVILPRFGFNYAAGETFFGETTFRGGAGVFAGSDPTVWFSNAFSSTGSNQGFGQVLAAGAFQGNCGPGDLNVLAGGQFTGVPTCVTDQQQAEAALGQGRVDAVDPDFDIPSVIRASFGFTHNTFFDGAAGGFFDDWTVNVDVIHTRRRNAPNFVDLTLAQTGVILPDGRPEFNAVDPLLPGCNAVFNGDTQNPNFIGSAAELAQGGACDAGSDDQDILLTNVRGRGENGGQTTFSISLAKGWDYTTPFVGSQGSLNLNLGYAFTNARDVNPTTSSTATSNFEEVATAVINDPVLSPSQFFNDHNITLAARIGQEFVPNYETSFNFFLQARSGRRFSYAFDNNTPTTLFGDSDNEERNLFYVPLVDDPIVTFADAGFTNDAGEFIVTQTAAEAEAGLNQFLASTGLDEFRGQISPRNAFRNPWFIDLDFRFQQELPGVRKQDRAIFFVDIENLPNLITDEANIFREHDNGDVGEAVPVLDAALSADGTQFIYSNFNPGGSNFDPQTGVFADFDTDDSVWSVQFGLRYEF
ncbi:MAG: carboxypeptidase regulatory-like domain-containing protein [Parvularculaceae bacterium]